MPRVAKARSRAAPADPAQTPIKVPLNDDRQEKAQRLHNRQALHDLQLNQIKAAAASPAKNQNALRNATDSPKTPQSRSSRGKENIDGDGLLAVVPGASMTPMKRVPILANFEEWMKMATDNKINATNSWNFALIDYFHDMSLLREGDGVNFQKASCTLDGCVKIYTSRVDSVATETGKLLSGLAESNSRRRGQGAEDDEEGEGDEEDDEEGSRKKGRKKIQRSAESTLAPAFSTLQLKKFELEFSVDPLFKKASADFDEGGAKGLLLNHLAIDASGRIVFDSSDDTAEEESKDAAENETSEAQQTEESSPPSQKTDKAPQPIDLLSLRSRFLPDLNVLDDQHVCPSLKTLDFSDPNSSMELPTHKFDDNADVKAGGDGGIDSYDDGFDAGQNDDEPSGFCEMPADTGFGEGGEVWAKDAIAGGMLHVETDPMGDDFALHGQEQISEEAVYDSYGALSMRIPGQQDKNPEEDILKYFDNSLRHNWAGPEHWRIRRMRDNLKTTPATTPRRKEKEPFEINFKAALPQEQTDAIYTSASSNSAISLPKSQWHCKSRNLLPDDKHFTSNQLLQLFLKPRARMGPKGSVMRISRTAAQRDAMDAMTEGKLLNAQGQEAGDDDLQGTYDANFFQDDGLAFADASLGDEDFADAQETFPAGGDKAADGAPIDAASGQPANGLGLGYGSQLVTGNGRARPEYVQYARTAKKVDVRRLKEEIWKGMQFEKAEPEPEPEKAGAVEDPPQAEPLKFTEVMNGLQSVYPEQAMADISTSYCFICLLHLANERGLEIGNENGLEELSIRQDMSIQATA